MKIRSTTIISVRKDGKVVIAGDGQVTMGHTIAKGNAKKVRRLYNQTVITGFAGATADAFTLYDRLSHKLEERRGDLMRAVSDMAKDWRTDKYLRRLEALLLVADKDNTFLLSGSGDIIEPQENVIAIGSGGNYAYSAALAYLDASPQMSARDVAINSLKIAGKICIYTNDNITIEEL